MDAVKEDPKCAALGIPPRLHRLGRPIVQDFETSELLYRRYDPRDIADQGLADASISFQHGGMSVNRQSLCESSEDVLYDVTKGGKHEDHSVLTFSIAPILQFTWIHPESKETYGLKIAHDPERCMYPHSLVRLFKGTKQVDSIKSASRKLQLKEAIIQFCAVPTDGAR